MSQPGQKVGVKMATTTLNSHYDEKRRQKTIMTCTTRENPETGERVTETKIEQKNYGRPRYVRVFTAAFLRAAEELDGTSIRVFSLMLDKVRLSDNVVIICGKQIQSALGMSRNTVARSLSNLHEADVIRMIKAGQWMINPYVATGCYDSYYQVLISDYFTLPSCEERKTRKEQSSEGVEDSATGEIIREDAAV